MLLFGCWRLLRRRWQYPLIQLWPGLGPVLTAALHLLLGHQMRVYIRPEILHLLNICGLLYPIHLPPLRLAFSSDILAGLVNIVVPLGLAWKINLVLSAFVCFRPLRIGGNTFKRFYGHFRGLCGLLLRSCRKRAFSPFCALCIPFRCPCLCIPVENSHDVYGVCAIVRGHVRALQVSHDKSSFGQ